MLYQAAYEEAPDLRTLRPEVPEHVDAAVRGALAKAPDERLPSAEAFLEALRREADGQTPGGRYAALEGVRTSLGGSASEARGTHLRELVRGSPWLVTSVIVVTSVLAAVALWPRQHAAFALYASGLNELRDHYDSAHLTSAIDALQRAVAADTSFPEAEAALAQAIVYRGRATEDTTLVGLAREHADRALQIEPQLPAAHVARGMVELWTGTPRLALDAFDLALHYDSASVDAKRGVGDAYLALDEREAAMNAFRAALELDSNDWYTHFRLGYAHYIYGQYEEAGQAWARVLKLTPRNGDALLNHGSLLFALERFDQANATFRRLVAVRPDGDAHANLGTSYFYDGDYRAAADQYELALRDDPGDYEKSGYLAAAYAALGDTARARRVYRQAEASLQAIPGWEDDPLLLSEFATYKAALGDDRDARQLIETATVPPPTSVYVMVNVASAYGRLEEPRQAAVWACRAADSGYSAALLKRSPALAGARTHLEECLNRRAA